jgi:quinol monooxygenase YgiN
VWYNVTRFAVDPTNVRAVRDFLLGDALDFARETDAHILSLLLEKESAPGELLSISCWRSKEAGEEIFGSAQYRRAMRQISSLLLKPLKRTAFSGVYLDIHEVPPLMRASSA